MPDAPPRPAVGRDPSGPFSRPASRRVLAALVVLAILATAWVGLARRRDDVEPTPRDGPPPTAPPVAQAAAAPLAPPPERGTVLPLIGDGDLPDGWTEVAGTWAADDTGIRLTEGPATGSALAVTGVSALPWATVSFSGTATAGWGVVFGYAGPDEHHVVTVDGGLARLLHVSGGVETEVASVAVPAEDEVVVAVDVSERNVAVHVGGAILGSVQVPTVEAAQQVGVRVSAGADPTDLRWTSIGIRARIPLDEPVVARGEEVTEMTPQEAREHLGP